MRRTQVARLVAGAIGCAALVVVPSSAHAKTAPTDGRAAAPSLTVDLGAGRHRISPLVYGVNFADEAFAKSVDLPVDRWGGEATETYNWVARGDNKGSDWYFENFADCWDDAHQYCTTGHTYSAADAQVRQDERDGTTTLLNLPTMGWVARKVAYTNTNECSYPRSRFPNQDSFDPYHDVCGNGRHHGQWVGPADPTAAGAKAGPSFSARWIKHLVRLVGTAAKGGVGIYELGNEPALWDQIHHAFHPRPTTYDELWSKSRAMAVAVKQADPTAATLGPAEWGWPNYFCSAADHVDQGCFTSSPDRAKHHGTDLSSWYLQQFAAYQKAHGKRLLDYFDLHYYPQGSYSPATDVTRSLYDEGYTDPSWIHSKIALLPRMNAWVAHSYPGTKTSVSEYNLGLGVTTDTRLQNVIEADALGIFGRQGLDLATFWPEASSPVPASAFLMFRNYDGHHHGFGTQGVSAVSTNQRALSVFAARRGPHGPLTIMVVNKTGSGLTSRLALRHSGLTSATAHAWQYAGQGIHSVGSLSVHGGSLLATYPAESITVIAVPLAG